MQPVRNRKEAEARVQSHLQGKGRLPEGDEIVVAPGSTRYWGDGWIVRYTSRRFLETGDLSYTIAGGLPYYVSEDGLLRQLSQEEALQYAQTEEEVRWGFDPSKPLVREAADAMLHYAQEKEGVADEVRTTLALPHIAGETQWLTLGFHWTSYRSEEVEVHLPFLQARAKLPSLEMMALPLAPSQFGLSSSQEPLGSLTALNRFSIDEYLALRSRYEELLSEVLGRRWLLAHPEISAEERAAAQEMREIVEQIMERALEPYYRSAAADLRAWTNRATR